MKIINKSLRINAITALLISSSCFFSANAQADYDLAKSSLDNIHQDAQLALNASSDATRKTTEALNKMSTANPMMSGIIFQLMFQKQSPYTYNDFVKEFNSLSPDEQYEQLKTIGNKSLALSKTGLSALVQQTGVNLEQLGKDAISASIYYERFKKLLEFEENNMQYISDIQHGPNLVANQYAELQFNLHMLNKMNKFQSGVYADLINTSLHKQDINVRMPYFVVGYQRTIGDNFKLGAFTNFAVNSISRNSKYFKKDEAVGLGLNTSYKLGSTNIALLANIIRHNQSFKSDSSEIFTVYSPTARYHLYSGDITFKTEYTYQPTNTLSLTPGFTYQYNYTQEKEVTTNYPGADFTSPALKIHSLGLNLLTQYQHNNWTIGLDLGAAYFRLNSGDTNEFGKLGVYKSLETRDTSSTLQPELKSYYVQLKDQTYKKKLHDYKLYINLDLKKKLSDNVNLETMLGYVHYSKTKLHGINWGVKINYLF